MEKTATSPWSPWSRAWRPTRGWFDTFCAFHGSSFRAIYAATFATSIYAFSLQESRTLLDRLSEVCYGCL